VQGFEERRPWVDDPDPAYRQRLKASLGESYPMQCSARWPKPEGFDEWARALALKLKP
jgi:hypothetical protein